MSDLFLFAGGGTGGHLTPGMAVAEALLLQDAARRILFVGSGRAIERSFLEKSGYQQSHLPAESLRTAIRRPHRFLWNTWRTLRGARRMLDEHQPRAVIGLGGFASAALVHAASRRRIPTLILEQNAVPGRTTRWLSHCADVVCASFDGMESYLARGARIEVTGNPVRREIAALAQSSLQHPARKSLLILGGSQGAAAINEALLRIVASHRPLFDGWSIVHQTGAGQDGPVRAEYQRLGLECTVEPFFSDMATRYQQAGLAVCRAGATTLAELACAGCPAVLIPYPHAAHQHQHRNAEAYERRGAARTVLQRAAPQQTAAALAGVLPPLLQNPQELKVLSTAMRSLARPDATARVLNVLESLLQA